MSMLRRRAGGCLVVAVLTLTTVAGGAAASGPVEPVGAAPAGTASQVQDARTPTRPTAVAPDGPSSPDVMTASWPVTIEMAAIGVSSDLMELGLLDDGTMEVPPGAFPAGWFSGAPTPGELGPAVIVGHIDWLTGPGVFARLGSSAVGDEIRVRRADDRVAVFRVVEVARYPKDRFPTDLVYGDIDHAGLRVISCGGVFDDGTGHYRDNIVVFAELVGEPALRAGP